MRKSNGLIYLDNGATSFPKPPAVWEEMERFLRDVGGSPGRSGHRLSQEAARVVFDCRERLAGLFAVPDSRRIVFTLNATEALNMILLGFLADGDRVVTTSMEHNSVMRPLRELVRSRGVDLEVVASDRAGRIDLEGLRNALRTKTRLVVVNHASNVTGALAPLAEIGSIAREGGACLLVDAAQSAGVVPIDVVRDGIDLLAFTGHKGLLGPQGTGGLWVREGLDLSPLLRGGTGSNSELEEQPEFYPDRLESGTPNGVGIAGLGAALRYIVAAGIEAIRDRERARTRQLLEGLAGIEGLTLYGPGPEEERTAVVSFNIDGLVPSEAGFLLDEAYGILSRVGLHCAPGAHRTIGTFPEGTVRLSPGPFTAPAQIDRTVEACRAIAARAGGRR